MSALARARDALARTRTQTDAILVGLSGGKDSLITLDLCVSAFPRVESLYMQTVPGLRAFDGPVDRAVSRWRVALHRRPHWVLSHLLRKGIYGFPRPGVSLLYLRDVEDELRTTTGIEWFAYGHRLGESLGRLGMMRKHGEVDTATRRVYPILSWSIADAYAYLRRRRIPLPDAADASRNGNVLSARTLDWLRIRYPDDYDRVLEMFPYAESSAARSRFSITASAIRDAQDAAPGTRGGPVQPAPH